MEIRLKLAALSLLLWLSAACGGPYGGTPNQDSNSSNNNPPSGSSPDSEAHISGLTLSPTVVVGGNPVVGTLSLVKPAPQSAPVSFTSSADTDVQGSVNIAQGQKSVTFIVNTEPVAASTSSVITAKYNNSTIAALLTIVPPQAPPPPQPPPSEPSPGEGTGSSTSSNAVFVGCIHRENGIAYQGVWFKASGTGGFDGKLFWGKNCDPAQLTDEIGFGAPMSFGGFGWEFWFIHYPNKLNTSGIWTVGTQQSQCIDYSVAPDCN